MRPGPHVELIQGDLREGSGLEGLSVVTVDPILAAGLVTLDGPDLNHADLVAVGDDSLPALVIQVITSHVNPLKTKVGSERNVVKFVGYVRSC